MSLIPCPACGNETSKNAEACPKCGEPVKKTLEKKQSAQGCLVIIIAIIGFAILQHEPETPEQKAAREAEEIVERENREADELIERQKKEQEEAENKRKGFHCLSLWDGSHTAVKNYAENSMRDPDSFEHIETRIAPVDENGEHRLLMRYRARNGFGGMSVGNVVATVKNDNCQAEIISID